jgi:hypothetical protein
MRVRINGRRHRISLTAAGVRACAEMAAHFVIVALMAQVGAAPADVGG